MKIDPASAGLVSHLRRDGDAVVRFAVHIQRLHEPDQVGHRRRGDIARAVHQIDGGDNLPPPGMPEHHLTDEKRNRLSIRKMKSAVGIGDSGSNFRPD